MSDAEVELYHSGSRKIDERVRGRLQGIFRRKLAAECRRNGNGYESLVNPKKTSGKPWVQKHYLPQIGIGRNIKIFYCMGTSKTCRSRIFYETGGMGGGCVHAIYATASHPMHCLKIATRSYQAMDIEKN